MPRKNLADHVVEVLSEGEFLEASRIRDRLHDRMRGGTPSIREPNLAFGKKQNGSISICTCWTDTDKKIRLEKSPEKKLVKILREGGRR